MAPDDLGHAWLCDLEFNNFILIRIAADIVCMIAHRQKQTNKCANRTHSRVHRIPPIFQQYYIAEIRHHHHILVRCGTKTVAHHHTGLIDDGN